MKRAYPATERAARATRTRLRSRTGGLQEIGMEYQAMLQREIESGTLTDEQIEARRRLLRRIRVEQQRWLPLAAYLESAPVSAFLAVARA